MSAGRGGGGDLGEMQVHRLGVADGQDQSDGVSMLRADSPKYLGGRGAWVLRRDWPRPPPGPAPRGLRLLPDAGFVGEPDLYAAGLDAVLFRDPFQERGEARLKSSMAASAWS